MSQSIFSTLVYHSIFDYPLTLDEIHRYLISDRAVPLPKIKNEIDILIKAKKVVPSSLTALRQRRKEISQKKLIIAKRVSRIISIIPWVKMVAVTGALAMENADKNDDIDLMIVTSNNRLWVVRLLVFLFASCFFKRRRPIIKGLALATQGQALSKSIPDVSNAICLNLWLDESALKIPVGQRNLYTAHELAQMKPVANKGKTYEKMLIQNKWGEKFLANFWSTIQQFNNLTINNQQFFTHSLLNLLNLFFFHLQFTYMKSKMTSERVSLHSAFFHPGNRADTILKTYDRLCHRNL